MMIHQESTKPSAKAPGRISNHLTKTSMAARLKPNTTATNLPRIPNQLTESNKKLAEKYNRNGSFPLVILLDTTGKVIGMTGFKNISATDYIQLIHSLLMKMI